MQTVYIFKLSTSEEVVAAIARETDDQYILSKPRTLAPMQTENGSVTLALIPWLMGAQDPNTKYESDVSLKKGSVVGIVFEPPKALIDMYLSKTSGIEIVTG